MSYTSELVSDIAMLDVDFALKGLRCLNEDGPADSSADEAVLWAHFLCTYSRFVHLNTWTDHESIQRVNDEFIPEFERPQHSIEDLLRQTEEYGFDAEQVEKLGLYLDHIVARLNNLKANYCTGLDTAFDPGDEYPPVCGGPTLD